MPVSVDERRKFLRSLGISHCMLLSRGSVRVARLVFE